MPSFNLTPEQMASTPVATPPPGVIPNFEHPTWRVPEIYGIGISFLTIAIVLFSIRIYTKIFIWKAVRWEDATMTLGLMTTIAYFFIMAWSAYSGSIGKHGYETYLATVYAPESFAAIAVSFSLLQPAYLFIKATIFLQYYHLFSPIRWFRIAIIAGLSVTVLFYTAMTIILFWCSSVHPGETMREALFSPHWILGTHLVLPPGVVGIILDWYLLILPIPAILRLNLSRSRKIGVLSVFMTGLFACIASIITLYYRVQLSGSIADPSWDFVPIVNWAIIELTCGIITANAPFLHLWWQRQPKLVLISTKVKTSMRSVFGLSAHSHLNRTPLENRLKNGQKEIKPPMKKTSIDPLSDEGILVTQEYSVNRSRTNSDATKVHSIGEESEIEVPLPVHRPSDV